MRFSKYTEPAIYSFLVIAPIIVGFVKDEEDFPHYTYRGVTIFAVETFAHKWELLALFSTLLLLASYWVVQVRTRKHFDRFFGFSNFALFASALLIVVALATITAEPKLHFAAVFLVSLLFLANDYFTYKGLNNEKFLDRYQARLTYLFADWPVFTAFFCLGLFCFYTHELQHSNSPWIFKVLYQNDINNIRELDIREYFMAGAIAFQFLASNVVFLVIMWRSQDLIRSHQEMEQPVSHVISTTGTGTDPSTDHLIP